MEDILFNISGARKNLRHVLAFEGISYPRQLAVCGVCREGWTRALFLASLIHCRRQHEIGQKHGALPNGYHEFHTGRIPPNYTWRWSQRWPAQTVRTRTSRLFNGNVSFGAHHLLWQVPVEALPPTWAGKLLMMDHMAGFVSRSNTHSLLFTWLRQNTGVIIPSRIALRGQRFRKFPQERLQDTRRKALNLSTEQLNT